VFQGLFAANIQQIRIPALVLNCDMAQGIPDLGINRFYHFDGIVSERSLGVGNEDDFICPYPSPQVTIYLRLPIIQYLFWKASF
jgi:hypothetical protein